jgi:hypothetical protein
MGRELTPQEREAEARASLNMELKKWAELQVHPASAIAVDHLMFNSRFHALLDLLEEAKLIDRDEHEIRALGHLEDILKERREEITPEIQETRRLAAGGPLMLIPKDGKIH